LAVLLCFLLAPAATRLEKWKLDRIPSVLIVVTFALTILSGLGYVMTVQVLELAEDLPGYKENVIDKLRSFRGSGDSSLGKAAEAIQDVTKAVAQPATTQASQPTPAEFNIGAKEAPVVPKDFPIETTKGVNPANAPLPGFSPDKPLWVAPGNVPMSPMQLLTNRMGTLLSPLGTAGLVIIFMIFMLFQRQDLRDRLIRLIGHGQLHMTTTALDDAAHRISKYLMAQAVINGTYGIAISIGLWLIGETLGDKPFPNFILWGVLCAVLRFIPYIGPWVAATFPILLSFAIYKGSGVFVATIMMFVVIELISNNFMEPWLYGSSTGMSTIAVLISAVFWTFLWGPVGLLLATPLTVCLVVLGKYVPQMKFLDIMLGDQPVLSLPERVYQRLLAQDEEEATAIAEEYLEKNSLEKTYDDVMMPALSMAEQDRHHDRLDDTRLRFIHSAMKNMIDELGDLAKGIKPTEPDADQSASDPVVPQNCTITAVMLPVHDEGDDIAGMMLSQLLELRGYCSFPASVTSLAGEMVELVEEKKADIVCVSAMPPAAVTHSRYLCKRINVRFPDLKMVVGLWAYRGDLKKAAARITCGNAVQVVTTLAEAIRQIHQVIQPILLQQGEDDRTDVIHASGN
jgi:predicted PurR-regulated permease PerM